MTLRLTKPYGCKVSIPETQLTNELISLPMVVFSMSIGMLAISLLE